MDSLLLSYLVASEVKCLNPLVCNEKLTGEIKFSSYAYNVPDIHGHILDPNKRISSWALINLTSEVCKPWYQHRGRKEFNKTDSV